MQRMLVLVRVRDTGQGMAQDVASRVFEPYFTTKGTRGPGLASLRSKALCAGVWIKPPGSGREPPQ
jgi:sensor histidine kinase regulating citrate/malate metabolism